METLTRQEKINVASAIGVALVILFALYTFIAGPGTDSSCQDAVANAEHIFWLEDVGSTLYDASEIESRLLAEHREFSKNAASCN